jgi:hypothetical protein
MLDAQYYIMCIRAIPQHMLDYIIVTWGHKKLLEAWFFVLQAGSMVE